MCDDEELGATVRVDGANSMGTNWIAGAATLLAAALAPIRLRPRPASHLCTTLAFRPCASATAETEAPGCRRAFDPTLWVR